MNKYKIIIIILVITNLLSIGYIIYNNIKDNNNEKIYSIPDDYNVLSLKNITSKENYSNGDYLDIYFSIIKDGKMTYGLVKENIEVIGNSTNNDISYILLSVPSEDFTILNALELLQNDDEKYNIHVVKHGKKLKITDTLATQISSDSMLFMIKEIVADGF